MGVFGVVALLSLSEISAQDSGVAVVDSTAVLRGYYVSQELAAETEAEATKLRGKAQERITNIQAVQKELQDLSQKMNDPKTATAVKEAVRQDGLKKQQLLAAMQQELRESGQRGQRALRDHQMEKMASIRKEVTEAIQTYASDEGFTYVFDIGGRSATQTPFVLYVKDKTDITQSVLDELNKDQPASETNQPQEPAAE